MSPSTIIIAAVIAVVVIAITVRHFRNLKNGTGCHCGGSNCGACGCCDKANQ